MATIVFDSNEEKINWKRSLTCNCDMCGNLTDYSEKYDSWYCPDCNIWCEVACSDPNCEYCKDRPETPIGI